MKGFRENLKERIEEKLFVCYAELMKFNFRYANFLWLFSMITKKKVIESQIRKLRWITLPPIRSSFRFVDIRFCLMLSSSLSSGVSDILQVRSNYKTYGTLQWPPLTFFSLPVTAN